MVYSDKIKEIDAFFENRVKKQSSSNNKRFFVVPMFPYPSGNIHMGHVRNYTISNVVANYKKKQGYEVIHPIGFDAFGLPAEDAAIKNKIAPSVWTHKNIDKMINDFNHIGFDFNWEAQMKTCDFEYYKFEQEIFKKAWEHQLIYKKEQYVNYDPVAKTVLSNEQVQNGCGWRTGAKVIRKKVPMYFFNMKKYAIELYNGLKDLEGFWPKKVIEMQKNWIGYEQGHNINIQIFDKQFSIFKGEKEKYSVISVGVNNSFVDFFKNDSDFINWTNENSQGSVSQKESFKTQIIFKTDFFVEVDNKVYPIIIDFNNDDDFIFENMTIDVACKTKVEIISVEESQHIKLKDWGISRQRYWGNPIPIIHCEKCGDVLSDNFVKLPENLIPDGEGNVLEKNIDFINCSCPKCGSLAKRSSDTMDTFVQSSWYFHYYITKYEGGNYGIGNKTTKINHYVGGIEHATMHLIYTRFFHKMLRDFGYVNTDEPIEKLTTQGMVCKKFINQEGKIASAKMSKSLGNIVEPKDYVEKYGSDALQMFMIFAAPPDKNFDFEDAGIIGTFRFLEDVYRYFFIDNTAKKDISEGEVEKQIVKMEKMFESEFNGRFNLNVLIPQLMTSFKTMKKTNFENINVKIDIEKRFVNCLEIFAPKIGFFIAENYF